MEVLMELKRRWVARFGCERSRLEVEQSRLSATDDPNPLARDFRQTFRKRLRTKQQSMEIRSLKSASNQIPRAVRCFRTVEKAPEFIRPALVHEQTAMDALADEEQAVGEITKIFPAATVSATVPATVTATVPTTVTTTVPVATVSAATVPAAIVPDATVTGSYNSNNFRNGKVASSHTGIFVGNIPLQTTLDDCFGRILKQINTTLLALIPKVHSPMNVGDFRPISCCNVLYKIIAKLLVQRLSVILDKLISPCQAAFVPGRSIGDNIMLAQELFTGYNQTHLPPRCALKVDIRKAYDTVEWDFLIAVMELFGFPHTFVKWIEECVTTPSFSVGLNGKPHGFFTGAKGLRQGDPLSPYLFVLVMEVLQLGFLQLIYQDELFSFHWKCDAARIFQLGFADDLLLFCRADMNSIGVFKTGLDRFAEWSGLRLNVQKSHLIISRSAQGLREEMLEALGFQEGVLPMRYLGLPLLSSRLTVADCNPLLLKIDKRIAGWEGMALSYAGRGITNSGYAKVAWKDLCRPKDEGGIGFKDIAILNRTLMTKKLCDIIRCDRTSIWVEWLYQGRLRDTSIWTIRENGGSWGWRKILHLRAFLRPMVDYQIGDGRTFYLWQDPWHYLGPLSVTFPRGPRLLRIEESARLSTVISEGEWQWPPITDFECLEITHGLPTIHGGEDRIIWRFDQGKPTTQALYRLFDLPGPKVGWASLLSGSLKIPRHLFILWLAILGKLATTDKSCADLVDSVSQLSGEWYDILGPIETGKRILNGLPKNGEVTATANGFFFFQFKSVIDMEEVIKGGPWLFQGQPIVLQKWEPGMAMRKLKHTQAPVWIKLRHLPMEFWTTYGLSTVASGVGKPLYPDAITRASTRLDFTRVCVMVDVSQNLPNHVIIMTPDEDGGETPCKVYVEYEWLPPKCFGLYDIGALG
ncbi:UNVERIFIED_CONTAM: hypothetical protein Sindi_2653900 [Sesamum indicum]